MSSTHGRGRGIDRHRTRLQDAFLPALRLRSQYENLRIALVARSDSLSSRVRRTYPVQNRTDIVRGAPSNCADFGGTAL